MPFVKCTQCKRTLIERKQNGLFRFRFGKFKKDEAIIKMEIQGSVKITCPRKTCRHVNVLNYLPTF